MRRYLQFRLRTLFIAALVVALACWAGRAYMDYIGLEWVGWSLGWPEKLFFAAPPPDSP